jgi:hypothetical protein
MAEHGVERLDVLAIDEAVARSSGAAGFGVTDTGFVPKPFARLLGEKLAVARALFGADLDLGPGSALRKILEISALEDARTWAALAAMYDNQFVASAHGDALARLGEELGLPRPFLEARGTVKLTATLPATIAGIELPRGARLLTAGHHHVTLDERVALSPDSPVREVEVVAFYPGPEHNLDPNKASQKITFWTVEAIRVALSLVPGVRQVQVRDPIGGLDVDLPIFGSFNFIERLFGAERDLTSPYFFDVVVASTESAIWDGLDGLGAALEAAMEDLRPIGIRPRVQPADPVYVGIAANLVVKGLPLPRGSSNTVINDSPAAVALKQRVLSRVARYVDGLSFGEPVRFAEVMWAIMNEPGITDVQDLTLLRFPPSLRGAAPQRGENVAVRPIQIATFVDSDAELKIV